MITRWSIKELQHFQQQSLLVASQPSQYTQKDYHKAMRLHLLTTFQLLDQDELLDMELSDEEVCRKIHALFQAKKQNLLEDRELMKAMEYYLMTRNDALSMQQAYQIREDVLPSAKVAILDFMGTKKDIDKYQRIFQQALSKKCYHDQQVLCFDVEAKECQHYAIAADLTSPVTMKHDEIVIQERDEQQVLSLFHIGSHDVLEIAYKALLDATKDAGYSYTLPIRLTYLKKEGKLWKGNPRKYVTKVELPIFRAS